MKTKPLKFILVTFLLFFGLAIFQPANADESTYSPSAETGDWANPTNAYSSNGSYATSEGTESTTTSPSAHEDGDNPWNSPTNAYSSNNAYATAMVIGSASTTNSPSSSTGSGWANPNNAYADGGGYASTTSGNPGGNNVWGDYGFSLTGMDITQVRVRYDAWHGDLAGSSSEWVSPDRDGPSATWVDPELAYDGNTGTYAYEDISGPGWGDWLVLQRGTAVNCDSVRIWSERSSVKIDEIEVEVYYDSAWQNIYSGELVVGSYQTYPIGSTESIYQMRVRYYESQAGKTYQARCVEAQFNSVTPPDSAPQIEVDVSWNGGTNWSAATATTLTDTEATYWYDVTSATSWTPVTLNDTNFKVRALAQTVVGDVEVYLDWLPVEVTYQSATTTYDEIYGTFGITGTGTVVKVEIGYEAYSSMAEELEFLTSSDGGSGWNSTHTTANLGTSDPDSLTYIDVTSDETWTWTLLNDTNFKIKVFNKYDTGNVTWYIDHIVVRVTYTNGFGIHTFSSYGISLSGNDIGKVELGIEAFASSSEKLELTVSWDGGSSWATVQTSDALPGSDPNSRAWFDFTSATIWTPAKLDNTNFRAKITYKENGAYGTIYLDWLPVRITYYEISTAKVLVDKNQNAYQVRINSSLSVISVYLNDQEVVSAPIDRHVWRHVALTYDGSNVKLYIDGVEKDSFATSAAINTNYAPLKIGKNSPVNMDDVRIYNYARLPDEIRLDYNAGFGAHFGPQSSCDDDPGACMTLGLTGYWNFDEGGGVTAYDSSGMGNDMGASLFCTTDDQKHSTTTINGDIVYCDNSLRMWAPTAIIGGSATTYQWGGYGTDEPTDSCIGVASRPACNYCDNLSYAGYSNWELPSCVSGAQNSNCILYQFGIDACGGYGCAPSWDSNANTGNYWSSTENDQNYAFKVDFANGSVAGNVTKLNTFYVRCVRGEDNDLAASWIAQGNPMSRGSALSFNGVNEYLSVGDVGSVRTVEFWLNDSNSTDGILELTGSNYISISASAISLTGFNNSTVYVNGMATTTLGSGWNHVIVVSDTVLATDFTIGEANSDYMEGSIDEVKIYSRALSVNEIRYHHNKGKPIAHWKFDEGSGTTAYDSGEPGGNNGTLENGPQWVAGKYGLALSFDGDNDYVGVPHSSSLNISDEITLSAWMEGPPPVPWLLGYDYRKQITINGSTAGGQEDYQMELSVHKGSGTDGSPNANDVYLNSHCQDDFYDIRFTKSDGLTELYHWREEYTSGVTSTFWIKFDSIPANPDSASFYIYYDKAGADSGSSLANTFDSANNFEENWDDGDYSGWTYQEGGQSGNYGSGTDTGYGGTTYSRYIYRNIITHYYWGGGVSYSYPFTAEIEPMFLDMYFKYTAEEGSGTQYNYSYFGIEVDDDGTTRNLRYCLHYYPSVPSDTETSKFIDKTGEDQDTWHNLFQNIHSDLDGFASDKKLTEVIKIVYNRRTDSSSSTYNKLWTDEIKLYVRGFVDPEPTWGTWGDEETGSGWTATVVGKGQDAYQLEIDNNLNAIGYINGTAAVTSQMTEAWHHLALTYDRSNVRLYIDGIEEDSYATTAAISTNSDNLKIGESLPGKIDDVRIYNYSRTIEKIRTDYNQGMAARFGPQSECDEDPGACMTLGLVGFWNFDEGGGFTAYDSSGMGNDGQWFCGGRVEYADQAYATVKIGSQCWMAENLNVGTMISSCTDGACGGNCASSCTVWDTGVNEQDNDSQVEKYCYNDLESYCDTDGGLYQWAEAMSLAYSCNTTDCSGSINSPHQGICPSGWHLPTDNEFKALEAYLGCTNQDSTGWRCDGVGTKLKSGGTSGFEAELAGYRDESGIFSLRSSYGYLWLSSQFSATKAWIRLLVSSNAGVLRNSSDKVGGFSVRCLKDGSAGGSATWSVGRNNSALSFNGIHDYLPIGNAGSIKTIEFWVKSDDITSHTDYVIDLNGTDYIKIVDGEVTVNNISSPTYYVDGVSGEQTIPDTTGWHHVAIATETGINASDLDIGRLEETGFFAGGLDEVKIYDRVLSATEIRYHYNGGKPIAHWKFDEGSGTTTYDGSGNANQGTLGDGTCLPGSGTCPSWTSGRFGSALGFDGSDDYISDTSLSTSLSGDVTFSLWFKSTASHGYQARMGELAQASTYGIQLCMGPTGEVGLDNTGGPTSGVWTATAKNDGVWHHLVVTRTNTTYKVYVDGDYIRTSGGTAPTYTRVFLGERSDSSSNFNGIIDDVRIYNYARTPDEIRLDYNAGFETYFR